MAHSIFGWSYPPGCSGPPDPPEGPCAICGKRCDLCECPECPECGDMGCLTHMERGQLEDLLGELSWRMQDIKREIERRPPLVCPACGAKLAWQEGCDACMEAGERE